MTGAPVNLPVPGPGGAIPAWLVPAVMEVLERVGGTTYRVGTDGLAALVTARTADDFDVVLELTPAAITLRVWGLERGFPLPADDPAAADQAAQRAFGDWLALLDGEAQLVVYYRGGVACCWTVTGHDRAPHPHGGWHPRRPPARHVRWLLRWRRRVLANRFLDVAAARDFRDRVAGSVSERAATRRATAGAREQARDRAARAPVVAA